MLTTLLKKLIKAGSGRIRFLMAVIGLSVAMLLILSAVQLQVNYDSLLHGKNSGDSLANFLVINKPVSGKGMNTSTMTEEEISDLKKQSFTQAIGVLTPSRFKVSASGGSNLPFYTDMFFESVPDEFIDVKSNDWNWGDNSQFIPMIVPNSFLDMYNFGFAASQSLPQLSPQVIMGLPIQINMTGPQGVVHYYAKTVGFSDRISSVLVPQQFMNWANDKFGADKQAQPSRVIIKTKDAGDPGLSSYLASHNLQTDTEKTRFSKYRQVVDAVVNISGITGALMLLFALLIFTLFIQLTIASSKDDISLLIMLGAAPGQLYQFLIKQFFPVNIIITVAVLTMVSVLQFLLQHVLAEQNILIHPYISFYTVGAAVLILLVLWIVNRITIKKYIG